MVLEEPMILYIWWNINMQFNVLCYMFLLNKYLIEYLKNISQLYDTEEVAAVLFH